MPIAASRQTFVVVVDQQLVVPLHEVNLIPLMPTFRIVRAGITDRPAFPYYPKNDPYVFRFG